MGSIVLEGQTIQEPGTLTLHISREVEINIMAAEAQRAVNRFVHMAISTQLHAETPTLAVGDRTYWQVPIHLTFPAYGDVGCVGHLRIDTVTGKIDDSPSAIQALTTKAEAVALRFASPTAHAG